MGLITSRLNLDGLHTNRRRSHQGEEQLYSYSLNKNYFSNYFFMGGERFEMNDPDYLFGDSCDLNFLTCTKPYSLPYKKAQQNLLTNLNTKQKAINKVSSRVGGLNTPLNILTVRHRQVSQARKQDAQTQTLNQNRKTSMGAEPTQPLVMLINIRKETLRLVKSNSVYNLDSDQNSLTNTASESAAICEESTTHGRHSAIATTSNKNHQHHHHHRDKNRSGKLINTNRYSTASSHTTTIHPQDSSSLSVGNNDGVDGEQVEHIELEHTMYGSSRRSYHDSDDISSITSHTLSTSQSTHTTGSSTTGKSGYTSVRDVPPSDSASDDDDDDENDEYFEDALNEPANDDDNDSERTNQQKALLMARGSAEEEEESTRRNCDIKITIGEDSDEDDDNDETGDHNLDPTTSDTGRDMPDGGKLSKTNFTSAASKSISTAAHSKILTKVSRNRGSKRNKKSTTTTTTTTTSGDNKRGNKSVESNKHHHHHQQQHQHGASTSTSSNRVYNIEFYFDTEVDCSIRVSYFCTREVSSNNVTYKPQHATYKSKTYTYKRGLNQKFEQPEHTFQPYLFDEDLLIYKPLDTDGNYNSGAVFPIVIHCVALEGPAPRQSQSLVATVEKSQLDDSYSIKPLKQLIFVDGVQYILQDIYGIENKPLASIKSSSRAPNASKPMSSRNLRASCNSLYSIGGNNMTSYATNGSNMNLSDTASIASALAMEHRGSLISNNQFRSLGSENTFECVICMSEERDTMLLPCRHMCLCSSCAQSLRYQSSSCPICRCPFKAALNVRFIRRSSGGGGGGGSRPVRSSQAVPDQMDATTTATTTTTTARTHTKSANNDNTTANDNDTSARRESLTNSATPLLARQKSVGTDADSGLESSATVMAATASKTKRQQQQQQHSRSHDDQEVASGTSVEVHKINDGLVDANFELRSVKGRVAQPEASSSVESSRQGESLDHDDDDE